MRFGPIISMLRTFLVRSDVALCHRSDGTKLPRIAEERVLRDLAEGVLAAARAKQTWEDERTQEIDPTELRSLRRECRKSFFVPAKAPEKEVPEGV